jgi:hypothetical protein
MKKKLNKSYLIIVSLDHFINEEKNIYIKWSKVDHFTNNIKLFIVNV